jgi:peptidoglycan hydrolase CwlO-like protein
MKRLAIAVIVLGVALGGAYIFKTKETVIQYVQGETVTEVKEVNPLDEQIKQREKELEEKYNKIKGVEARVDVLKAERERLDTEITSLQKDLASFMVATSSKK